MDYQIIATLGPATASESAWGGLLAAGATAFRLNTSHLSLTRLDGWLERLQPFLAAAEPPAPLVLDLQGSKWRLGDFPPVELEAGAEVELVLAASTDLPGVLPVPHADFFAAAPLSDGQAALNDARVCLQVVDAAAERLRCRVTLGGPLAPHKGITFSTSRYRIERLSEKDAAILERTRGMPSVRYAISYIKDALEMQRYRDLAGSSTFLIAKLERGPAMAEAAGIASTSDEVWVCRGDLGAEVGLRAMAEAVHRFAPGSVAAPAILAGQVLEHMTAAPHPTRSELCYLYDALRHGYRGLVLSDETAIGRYPLESVQAAALFRPG